MESSSLSFPALETLEIQGAALFGDCVQVYSFLEAISAPNALVLEGQVAEDRMSTDYKGIRVHALLKKSAGGIGWFCATANSFPKDSLAVVSSYSDARFKEIHGLSPNSFDNQAKMTAFCKGLNCGTILSVSSRTAQT